VVSHEHLLLHFARNGAFGDGGADLLVLDRGEGPYVFDTDGRRYVDGLSSLFCAQLGYSYGEELGEVAAAQMRRLAFNTNWATASPPAIELADRLAALSGEMGLGKAFFTCGGSEAVEAAWKIARHVHLARGETQRVKAIARETAYHGVTLGALALTGVAPMKEPFGPPAIDVRHVANTNAFRPSVPDPLADLERAVEEEGPETIALIVAEPVQNAGGCLVPPDGYWQGLREIADRCGALLHADEVITGFGRLGEWFGAQRYGARPDIVTCAKGLTAAYVPMGAVLVRDEVAAPLYDAGRTLLHGVTFGGHPVCAAVALRVLEIYERDRVLENVRALEPHLESRLRELLDLPIVGDVRGAGFFWAVELVAGDDDARFSAIDRERLLRGYLPSRLREAGLIARADDRGDAVLQIAPPLIADRAVLDEIVDKMADVLSDAGDWIARERPSDPAMAG
jgi:adenosylmethionine-8-amino-7-oxononanoate aminotransferase